MKTRYILLLSAISVALITSGCCALKSVQEETVDEEVIVVETGPEYLFTLSFISKGAGIETSMADSVESYLIPLEEMQVIKVDRIRWGREGEIDYCVYSYWLLDTAKGDLRNKFNSMALRSDLLFFSQEGCLRSE